MIVSIQQKCELSLVYLFCLRFCKVNLTRFPCNFAIKFPKRERGVPQMPGRLRGNVLSSCCRLAKGKNKKSLWGRIRPDFFSWVMKKGRASLSRKSLSQFRVRVRYFTSSLVITGSPSNNENGRKILC